MIGSVQWFHDMVQPQKAISPSPRSAFREFREEPPTCRDGCWTVGEFEMVASSWSGLLADLDYLVGVCLGQLAQHPTGNLVDHCSWPPHVGFETVVRRFQNSI